ncbi:cbb3-type cytochrome c oxidase subunit 3 [Lysobacter sp. GX 14042]|uniref:cbb3-type cytochrome oxidase subunit 3 n=1 Tax=Lysobacter sp. GX 14042 TaxID=2907155 RepID=UPI001F431451|nr:cbb3-type cytochrome c oxidase subunit 3 [Lysobacter sp. GX 14042]MCE7033099.1 cbb3-type cytochrome c oxidase subunit 3 [Lysobacter sp. GX 14042]
MLSGIITTFMLLLFLAIVAWAWQPRNRKSFDATARLAVEEPEENQGRNAGGAKRETKKGTRA